jgi:hypothetical protein
MVVTMVPVLCFLLFLCQRMPMMMPMVPMLGFLLFFC